MTDNLASLAAGLIHEELRKAEGITA